LCTTFLLFVSSFELPSCSASWQVMTEFLCCQHRLVYAPRLF
jgi:hypothetical protein